MTDKALKSTSRAQIDAFLQKVAATPTLRAGSGCGRLIFAMDATASREPTWDQACHLQAEMFAVTDALGGLEVQLAYYRGFKEFYASKWQRDAAALGRAMTGVGCRGGYTQIARVLRHTLRETAQRRVQALVYVGDALEEGVDPLLDLAAKLGLQGVRAFMFQEGNDPAVTRAYREVARLSGGAYCPFDQGSAAQLRELLTAVARFAAGGLRALRNSHASTSQLTKTVLSQLESKP
jgi:hypothetical protein